MALRALRAGSIVLLLIGAGVPCLAQDSQSASVAVQLTQALSERGLDTVATAVPGQPDRFIAAQRVEGLGLLVLSARSSSPAYIADCIRRRAYKDAYSYLNGTALADGKLFIQDVGADGLRPKRPKKDAAFDITYQNVTKQLRFDGEADQQHMTDAQYEAAFRAMDAEYAEMLEMLVQELTKGG